MIPVSCDAHSRPWTNQDDEFKDSGGGLITSSVVDNACEMRGVGLTFPFRKRYRIGNSGKSFARCFLPTLPTWHVPGFHCVCVRL